MKKSIALLALSALVLFTGCNPETPSSSSQGGTPSNSTAQVEKEVSSIAVKSAPTKSTYYIGEAFDPTGCVITATYTDNTTEDIDLADERLSYATPNTESEGTKTIRVRMGSAQTTFQIEVIARTYDVTFDLNYENAPAPTVVADIKEGETVDKPEDPVRDGYDFQNWCTNTAGTEVFDFATPITQDLTLYANWVTAGATIYTVTFDLNYSTAPAATTQQIEEGSMAVAISDPSRKGYDFSGWYTAATNGTVYDFDTPVTSNVTIYAHWDRNTQYTGENTYVFEAEDVDFKGKVGNGFSGTATETAMIMTENSTLELGASNDRFVGFLYRQGLYLDFRIASDVAVENVKLSVSISQEYCAATYTPDMYQFSFNNTPIEYEAITFTEDDLTVSSGDAGGAANKYAMFRDVTLTTTLSLRAGTNLLRVSTVNNTPMGGTMSATAPLLDCFKLTATDAVLDWDASRGYPFDNY